MLSQTQLIYIFHDSVYNQSEFEVDPVKNRTTLKRDYLNINQR